MLPINEIWYVAVNCNEAPIWPYLELRRCDVRERLSRDFKDWKKEGWRIAKLHVREVKTN